MSCGVVQSSLITSELRLRLGFCGASSVGAHGCHGAHNCGARRDLNRRENGCIGRHCVVMFDLWTASVSTVVSHSSFRGRHEYRSRYPQPLGLQHRCRHVREHGHQHSSAAEDQPRGLAARDQAARYVDGARAARYVDGGQAARYVVSAGRAPVGPRFISRWTTRSASASSAWRLRRFVSAARRRSSPNPTFRILASCACSGLCSPTSRRPPSASRRVEEPDYGPSTCVPQLVTRFTSLDRRISCNC